MHFLSFLVKNTMLASYYKPRSCINMVVYNGLCLFYFIFFTFDSGGLCKYTPAVI